MSDNKKDFTKLTELLRKVNDVLSPYTYKDTLAALQRKDLRDRLYGKFPKCFLVIKGNPEVNNYFFSICNRLGMIDPKIISFSMKYAERLLQEPGIDAGQVEVILAKLKRLHSKYSKEVPKPANVAAKKAIISKMVDKFKNYLDDVRK